MEINGFIMQLNTANKYVSIAAKQIKEKIAAEKRAKAKAKADARKKETSSYSTNKRVQNLILKNLCLWSKS
jgi:hypothetical protein